MTTILVIEDDASIRTGLRMNLTRAGYTFEAVDPGDAEEAITGAPTPDDVAAGKARAKAAHVAASLHHGRELRLSGKQDHPNHDQRSHAHEFAHAFRSEPVIHIIGETGSRPARRAGYGRPCRSIPHGDGLLDRLGPGRAQQQRLRRKARF